MHLASPEVIDQRVPVLMKALARIGVLVERAAVETREPVRIGRKMPWYPVEDHAQTGAMAAIDEARERRRLAKLGHAAQTGSGADSPRSRRTDAP